MHLSRDINSERRTPRHLVICETTTGLLKENKPSSQHSLHRKTSTYEVTTFLRELAWLTCWLSSFCSLLYTGLFTIKAIGRLQPTQQRKHRLSCSLTNSMCISPVSSMVVACSLTYGFIHIISSYTVSKLGPFLRQCVETSETSVDILIRLMSQNSVRVWLNSSI